jgi:hypothetical protein
VWEYAGIIGINPAEFSLRELALMVKGKKSHDWDLFTPLICYAANPWLKEGSRLEYGDVHPFKKGAKKKEVVVPFDRMVWRSIVKDLPR